MAMNKPKSGARGVLSEWVVTILLLLFGTTNLVQAFVIPSGSMESTLLVGDHLLVDKLAYAPSDAFSSTILPYQDIERGDIIVFRKPHELEMTLVKRAIGLPGDRLRIVNKRLWINGKPVDEPYVQHETAYFADYRDNFPPSADLRAYPGDVTPAGMEMLRNVNGGELVVPEGLYFALGDNRDYSLDSRYWGFVPRENIIGKPLIIYWSYDAPTEELLAPGISPSHLKDLALNFFSKTRWTRTLHLIRPYPLER
jgi:signal peptidase I